jgi:hypothetical protein
MTGIAGHDAGMCGHDETEYARWDTFVTNDKVTKPWPTDRLDAESCDHESRISAGEIHKNAHVKVIHQKMQEIPHSDFLNL